MAASDSASPDLTDAVRDAVDDLAEVRLLPPPPLDLEAAQLAIDCTDETARCMGEVATRMQAQIVLVPTLRKRADALELHLQCFKQSTPETIATAMRKQAGTRLDSTLLATVPSMVREVIALPAAPDDSASEPVPELDVDAAATPLAGEQTPPDEPEETGEHSLIGPLVVGAGGAALVVAGVVFGAMASASESDYASRDIDTAEQAERAHAVRETGESQALTANILFATGGLALAAAGVWYLVDRPNESAPQTARVTPVLGPKSVGLMITSQFQP